ncbi:hypothetical protein ACVITL_002593 [Rhizobium pisi]
MQPGSDEFDFGLFAHRLAPRMWVDVMLWYTPLCPAGHLPHKGGDRLGAMVSPNNDDLACR